jgi:hypothetical protein
MPICAFVFMTMLASHPTMPPMTIVTIQPMPPLLAWISQARPQGPRSQDLERPEPRLIDATLA